MQPTELWKLGRGSWGSFIEWFWHIQKGMGNMILDVLVLLAKYHQPSWIKFFPCHFHLSWLSLEGIDCIIFGDLIKCYLFFFSYCSNLCVFFLQIDYNHLVSGSVVGSFRAGSSMTPPFLHDLVKSPLKCELAGDLLLTHRIQQKGWSVTSILDYTRLKVLSC